MTTQSTGGWQNIRHNVPAKAILILAATGSLALLIATMLLLADLRRQELETARGQIVSLSHILTEQTARTFEGVTLAMRNARDRISDDVGQHFALDSFPIHLLLKARVTGLPQVRSLFLVDRDGYGVNSSRPDFIRRLSVRERDFFRHFAEGNSDELFISPPERARVDGQWTYYTAMRLRDAQGRFRGLLVAAINIDHFESFYHSIGLNLGNRVQLLNDRGILLAGKPSDEAALGKPSALPATLAALHRQPAGGVVETMAELPDGPAYLALRKVVGYPLMIGVTVSEMEALATWRRVAQPIAIGVCGGLLFILGTTLLLLRNLLHHGRLEAALKESDEQLRHMVQSVRDAIVVVDAGERVLLCNDAAERMFGIEDNEAVGAGFAALLSRRLEPRQQERLQIRLSEIRSGEVGAHPLEILELREAEQSLAVELSLSTTIFRDQPLLTAIFRDVTERRRAERELQDSNRQLQALSAALENVREEERARISREMHDELGQFLTGIRFELSWLGGRLAGKQDELADKVRSIKGQIDQTISAVRRISSELRPLALDDLGFAAAATWYVDQFAARTGLATTLSLPAADVPPGSPLATALFRILQESLTNVARHAAAQKVAIHLECTGQHWRLTIEDDGCGFRTDARQRPGLGLVGMRERVQILRGTLSITATPGAGTRVEATIPTEPASENHHGQD